GLGVRAAPSAGHLVGRLAGVVVIGVPRASGRSGPPGCSTPQKVMASFLAIWPCALPAGRRRRRSVRRAGQSDTSENPSTGSGCTPGAGAA
ncbi:MAG TPA: hypothetical protein VII33_12965, partial [Nakamurella sp.]